MKQTILSLLMALLPLVAEAETVEIGGIYYNLIPKGKVAEVTRNPNYYSSEVIIPESVIYEGVTYIVNSIGVRAFSSCYELTSVKLPNSITTIGDGAFNNSGIHSSINIPKNLTRIGEYAFMDCQFEKVYVTDLSILFNLNYPDYESNPLRGARLYLNGQEVKEIIIPENVTHIGKYTFYEFNSLTSIIIPNSVTTIEDCAFYGCSGLTNVTIPNSVKSIGNEAFEWCNNLTSLTIPNSVTNILKRAFQGCSSLSSIIIPNSVTTITTGLFAGCKGLTNITIPHSVTSIRDKAFSDCI